MNTRIGRKVTTPHANRSVSLEHDQSAFIPTREISESGVPHRMDVVVDKFWLNVFDQEKAEESYELVCVIGEALIRQYRRKSLPDD